MNNEILYKTLIKPISTEKSVYEAEKNRAFVFKVSLKSDKKTIKYVVEKLFNVVVTNVRTLVIKGNKTKFKQIPGKKSDWKKAFISLKKGYEINLSNFK
jgi:large subunit ribosomal protein L23